MPLYTPSVRLCKNGVLVTDAFAAKSRDWGTSHVSALEIDSFHDIVKSYGGKLDLIDIAVDAGILQIPTQKTSFNPNCVPEGTSQWIRFQQYLNQTAQGHQQIAAGLVPYGRKRRTRYRQRPIQLVSHFWTDVDSNDELLIPDIDTIQHLKYIGYSTASKHRHLNEGENQLKNVIPNAPAPIAKAFVAATPTNRIAIARQVFDTTEAKLESAAKDHRIGELEAKLTIEDIIDRKLALRLERK